MFSGKTTTGHDYKFFWGSFCQIGVEIATVRLRTFAGLREQGRAAWAVEVSDHFAAPMTDPALADERRNSRRLHAAG